MEEEKEMITEFPSIIFRLKSKGTAPDMVILRKHNNRIFIAVVESDLPDAVTSRVAGTVLNFIVEKYKNKKSSLHNEQRYIKKG